MSIPDTGGVGRIPDWAGDDEESARTRKAQAKGAALRNRTDRIEAAVQQAEHAAALAEVLIEDAARDRAAAAEARREYERLREQERARAELDRERRGQPIARQVSSSSGDPFAGDLSHHPEVMRLIVSGASMAAINAKKAEISAARDQDRRDRERYRADPGIHGGGSIMWQTQRGDTMLDDSRARPRDQVSIVRAGVPELGTDAVLGGPTTQHFEAPRNNYVPDPQRQPREGYWSTPTAPSDTTGES